MKQQFLKAIAGTIRMTAYDNNRPLIPSAATITLYKSDGSSVLQATVAATISTSTGELTYSLTTTHTANLGLNYKAVWSYTVSGSVYYETQLFDVVRSILSIPITDDDLYAELPSLLRANVQDTGTATSAGAATFIDSKKRKETNDYWKGGVLEILSGTGAGQSRDITGFVQINSTFTVSPIWSTVPDDTSIYRVVKSWTATITQNFEKIEQMLYDKGRRDALILESSQIRIVLIYLTIYSIARDLREEKDDRWDLISIDYMELFEKAFNSLTLDYDTDESGGVEGDEVQQRITSIRIQRS